MSSEEAQPLYTETQKILLAIIPMVSGSLSLFGSSLIIVTILLDWRRKLRVVYHRLLLMMSAVDVITSAAMAASTLMVPEGHSYAWNSQGTEATCEAQGFLIGFGLTAFFYNAFLAIYYLMVIRYHVKQEVIAKYVEPLMHFGAFAYTITLISINQHRGMYVPSLLYSGWCGIAIDSPWGCSTDPDVECQVVGAGPLFNIVTIVPIGTGLVVVIASMISIYCAVRTQERSMLRKYGHPQRHKQRFSYHRSQESMKRTRETFCQGAMYCGAILTTMTCFCPSLFSSNPPTADHRTFYFATIIPIKLLFPLQGFWNSIVYFRPRYNALSEKVRDESFCTVLCAVVLGDTRNDVVENVSRRRSTPRLSISKLEDIFFRDPDSDDDDTEAQDCSGSQRAQRPSRKRRKEGGSSSVSFEDPLAPNSASSRTDTHGDHHCGGMELPEYDERTAKTDETSKTPISRLHYEEASSPLQSSFPHYSSLRRQQHSGGLAYRQYDMRVAEEKLISRVSLPSIDDG